MATKADITTIYNNTFNTNKQYKDLTTYEKVYGLILLVLNNSGGGSTTLDTITIRDKTNSTNKLSIDSTGQIGISNFPSTQAVSIATLPSLTTGTNTIGSINNILGTISLPTGAATSAKQPSIGTAGSASTDVITVQGITNGTAININQITNATTGTITFTASTTSSTFTITNRLALIIIPVIASAPTLTLQVSLDGGTTWVNTSITVTASASAAQTLEADSLAKVSGAFGLTNGFRFSSTESITATLNLRSIVQ